MTEWKEERSAFKIVTSTPIGERPLGRRRWKDYIRMDLKEIGIKNRNLTDSAQDRDFWRVLVVLQLRVS